MYTSLMIFMSAVKVNIPQSIISQGIHSLKTSRVTGFTSPQHDNLFKYYKKTYIHANIHALTQFYNL